MMQVAAFAGRLLPTPFVGIPQEEACSAAQVSLRRMFPASRVEGPRLLAGREQKQPSQILQSSRSLNHQRGISEHIPTCTAASAPAEVNSSLHSFLAMHHGVELSTIHEGCRAAVAASHRPPASRAPAWARHHWCHGPGRRPFAVASFFFVARPHPAAYAVPCG